MQVIAFDIKSSIAHFRKPDTTTTHLTYPFITPTAAKGMVGAILGEEDFTTSDRVGIRLLKPVRTMAQQMSMLGKIGGATCDTYNRPTTMELLVSPAYRIYYAGEEYAEKLYHQIREGKAVYPTYLGSAFALTKPVNPQKLDAEHSDSLKNKLVQSLTVVPVPVIEELELVEDAHYCRANGFLRYYTGNRHFEKSVDYLYEQNGKSITFKPKSIETFKEEAVSLFSTEEGSLCLL
ncbi:CRISPR-associated protein Cas5 [Tindallia californiensis]|uniref:CRISPR-associated protein, Cas5h family n=1 Tax=Tindallia californiensis TaxID=159292 RepID=A0A1H3PQH2_9FIRM|nr:CRISPR-associated protein Cas5 [Tindallia californiensis]SDZ03210.1 CRISPR-associated protein, Cas5h family [Tindallia californiensis]